MVANIAGTPAQQQPQAPPMVYITFSAEIVPQTTESLIATFSNLVNQGARNITLLLSTPGGAVMCGMNLYNFLRGLPIQLTTHNVGNVDSIGNAVFRGPAIQREAWQLYRNAPNALCFTGVLVWA